MVGAAGHRDGPPIDVVKRRSTTRPRIDPSTMAGGLLREMFRHGLSDAQIADVVAAMPKSRQAVQRAKARVGLREAG